MLTSADRGAVRDKNPLWAWALIFVSSAHAQPDVRNFLTSGNGCFQSPSFPDHVTKKRRALGTRMGRDKRDWTLDMMKRHLILRVSFFLLSFCVVLFLAVNIMISWFVSTLELSARLQNTRKRIWSDWKTLENQSANLQANSGLEGILSLNAG